MKKTAEKIESLMEIGGTKKDIAFLVISAIALILSLIKPLQLPFDISWVSIVLCGVPIVLEAIIGLVTRFDIKADVLVSLALIASVCIGEDFAAGEIAFIMQLGSLLEDLTVSKARAGIEKLVRLTPQTARLVENGSEKTISAQEVKVGDILRVLPGESIPVDGVIIQGQTSINQAVMTGESMPVDKTAGDDVSSGTVNQFGTFLMKAQKVGEDSSIQKMIRLVQSADAGKAKIVGLADKWATWIVVTALTAAVLTWIFSGEIIRAVTILVVFCPCSLVLATPTAIMAAIGNATKHGFLVRKGDALERLAKVKIVAFDKTGTLTNGTPKVIAAKSFSSEYSDDDLFFITASCEKLSEHPLAKAVVSSYEKAFEKPLCLPEDFSMIPGKGISASLNKTIILAGNEKLMKENSVEFSACEKENEFLSGANTVVHVAANGKYVGFIALADTPRPQAKTMISRLKTLGVTPVLLTGDNENSAREIAEKSGIAEFKAQCLPEDKLSYIDKRQAEKSDVCMIGDGINDAPALKKATVGIAMGGVGSDIAIDAADIALVDDEIKELPHLLNLSKHMMKTIKINLSFSMGLNFLAIILAITGTINPVVGALVHNAGSVLVIVNSALLLNQKSKKFKISEQSESTKNKS